MRLAAINRRVAAFLVTTLIAVGYTGTASAQTDMFLTVFDPNRNGGAGETFNVDLGESYVGFIASPTASFGENAALAAWIGGSADVGALRFDVAAENVADFGATGGEFITSQVPFTLDDYSAYSGLGNNIANYGVVALNQQITTSGNGFWNHGGWEGQAGGSLPVGATGGRLANPLALYNVTTSDFVNINVNPIGYFSLNAATGELTFGDGQPPVVPIPAAGWLLTSALIGLVGIGRRRRRDVAA